MSFHYIFILSVLFNMCESQDELKTVMEGDTVDLYYAYPCNSTRITVQCGRRLPLYILEDAESITLPPEQAKRFTFTNEKEDDHCLLFVRIKEVSRTDAGTYLFFAYIEDDVHYISFKKIGLEVDFLPEMGSCTISDENMGGDWVALDCIALVGSVSGQIDCYQNEEKMPSRTDPIETNKYLKQTILAKKKYRAVFCCTSTWEHTKEICECTDFQWDLANDKNLTSIIDPCGPTTPVQEHDITRRRTTFSSQDISVSTQGMVSHDKFIHALPILGLCIAFLFGFLLIATYLIKLVIRIITPRKKTKSCRLDTMYHQCAYPSPICHKSEEHKETATKENCELEMV